MSTPRDLGFRMPAEWTPHRRCWMIWPGADSVYHADPGRARLAFADVAHSIARFEPVSMWTNATDIAGARELLGEGVTIVEGVSTDCWMRDTGPTFLVDGEGALGAVDWTFNGYGGKYGRWEVDDGIAAAVAGSSGAEGRKGSGGAQIFRSRLVNEGGAIHVDGEGTVLITEDVLLNLNRNPGYSKASVERLLRDHLGVETVIWLPHGLVQDTDTDGHVDTVAIFARPGVVVAQVSGDRSDPNHDRLRLNLERLRAARDARGRAFEIVEVVEPKAMVVDGERLSLSYVNLYLANGGLVAPVFDVPEDEAALAVLGDAFPDRALVTVPSVHIFRGGGGIHCISQQEPLAPAR